jgi:predicted  nucleic acid-binding Zn-ribbon protein
MSHKCTKCGILYSDASPELLNGCSCGSKFFYYIREEKKEKLIETEKELEKIDPIKIEEDIRQMSEIEPEKPVILDLESIKVIEPGKFEIDLFNLFSKKRILIYKLEEGKYIIDLASSFKINKKEVDKRIKDPKLQGKESLNP